MRLENDICLAMGPCVLRAPTAKMDQDAEEKKR
jgi:hypothetical protein